MFSFLKRNTRRQALIDGLHETLVLASRHPAFYSRMGVPDSIEGRFEMLSLHVILLLRRLSDLPPPAADLAQDCVDSFFRHLEIALREMGVGDVTIPKRMKTLASAFYGRVKTYDALLTAREREALAEVFSVHLQNQPSPQMNAGALSLADYALACDAAFKQINLTNIQAQNLNFPDIDLF
jgi:cytochrome b pre-mRNA-processing protein 3